MLDTNVTFGSSQDDNWHGPGLGTFLLGLVGLLGGLFGLAVTGVYIPGVSQLETMLNLTYQPITGSDRWIAGLIAGGGGLVMAVAIMAALVRRISSTNVVHVSPITTATIGVANSDVIDDDLPTLDGGVAEYGFEAIVELIESALNGVTQVLDQLGFNSTTDWGRGVRVEAAEGSIGEAIVVVILGVPGRPDLGYTMTVHLSDAIYSDFSHGVAKIVGCATPANVYATFIFEESEYARMEGIFPYSPDDVIIVDAADPL